MMYIQDPIKSPCQVHFPNYSKESFKAILTQRPVP